jgi:hypothetical protein
MEKDARANLKVSKPLFPISNSFLAECQFNIVVILVILPDKILLVLGNILEVLPTLRGSACSKSLQAPVISLADDI